MRTTKTDVLRARPAASVQTLVDVTLDVGARELLAAHRTRQLELHRLAAARPAAHRSHRARAANVTRALVTAAAAAAPSCLTPLMSRRTAHPLSLPTGSRPAAGRL